MTKVLHCASLFGVMTLAAALDAGQFGDRDERRVLLVSDTAESAEAAPSLTRTPEFDVLRARVDAVVSWNELIAPLHPFGWQPRDDEQPMLTRLLHTALDLTEDPSELVLDSIAVAPSRTLATLIRDCPITVFSEGLMSYGPTRSPLGVHTGERIERLLYLDIIPGLRPVLLSEWGVPTTPVPASSFTKILAEVAERTRVSETLADFPRGAAMVLGQYLAAVGIMTPAEECELYAGMVRAAARAGYREILFKPHPAGGRAHLRAVSAAAEHADVTLLVVPESVPAELCLEELKPELVVGSFSTALLTARRLFDLPIASFRTAQVLEGLTPYENSNRIPATIVAALVPQLVDDGAVVPAPGVDLESLVGAVSYCMQPKLLPELRGAAADYLAAHGPDRYFRLRRLRKLELVPPTLRDRLARSNVGRSPAARTALTRARAIRAQLVERR